MESFSKFILFASTLILLILYNHLKARQKAKKYNFPPLVPGLPFFGNTFQIPTWQQGGWGKSLAAQYGEM